MLVVVQGLKTIHAVEGKKFELDFEVIFLVELEVLRIQVFEICIKKLVFLIGSLTSLFSLFSMQFNLEDKTLEFYSPGGFNLLYFPPN